MSFVVITDSSANLPTLLSKEKGIEIITFPYYIDGEEYHCSDTDAFQSEEYYAKIKKGAKITTSQIIPQRYREAFDPWLQDGKDIICVCMASGISGSFQSARIGAEEALEAYPERQIEVIDALGASLGQGLLALEAAELRDKGMTVAESAAYLREQVQRMFNVFTVDDLMHLRRGGRLSNFSAVIGTVLHIKPLLKGNENGKIVAFAKIRGRKQSVQALANMYDRLVVDPESQTVGIAQAACKDDAEALAALLRKNNPPKEILMVDYEPVTGAHVGPGALALFFLSTPQVRLYNGDNIASIVKQTVAKVEEKTPEFVKQAVVKAGEKAPELMKQTVAKVEEKTPEFVKQAVVKAGETLHKITKD